MFFVHIFTCNCPIDIKEIKEIRLDDRSKTLVHEAPSFLLMSSVNSFLIHLCTYAGV